MNIHIVEIKLPMLYGNQFQRGNSSIFKDGREISI